ncbi:MAG: hypothetical protein L3J24_00845 [Xanthomonadales bacterium]|nr:hypothetical protein [Xanthomonadales bacterium]
MQQRATKFKTLKPWRRYIGLFLSVVWLSVLAQSCLMAGSIDPTDSGYSDPSTTQTTHIEHNTDTARTCQSPAFDCQDCNCLAGKMCSQSIAVVSLDSAAAFEQKTNAEKFAALTSNTALLVKSHFDLNAFLQATAPENFPPGPAIIDLHQSYLL